MNRFPVLLSGTCSPATSLVEAKGQIFSSVRSAGTAVEFPSSTPRKKKNYSRLDNPDGLSLTRRESAPAWFQLPEAIDDFLDNRSMWSIRDRYSPAESWDTADVDRESPTTFQRLRHWGVVL